MARIGIYADNKTIILGDDIFDSFDNKNILYVISLLKKTIEFKRPLLMIFTHDIEIFGMLNRSLKIKTTSSFIMSRKLKEIEIKSIDLKNMNLEDYIRTKNNADLTIEMKVLYFFILSINGRNLIERTYGQDHECYITITNLLHIKENSYETILNISKIANFKFLDFFTTQDIKDIEDFSKRFKSYFSMVKNIFEYCKKSNIDKIELNIFFSLYGRLYIENTILKRLSKKGVNVKTLLSGIKTYQTGVLLNEYKKEYGTDFDINALNDYITKFIHINQGLSYLINIDNKVLLNLINNIK